VIGIDAHYSIDLNHDGMSDVSIRQFAFHSFAVFFNLYADPAEGNAIEVGAQHHSWAAALKSGANIGYTRPFNGKTDDVNMAHSVSGKDHLGYWFQTQPRYLGVEFLIKGKTHFGWARFKNSSPKGTTLTGYAYETIPGKSIIAGQTQDAAGQWDETGLDTGASLTSPIPDTPQPASLGMLALGAQGVPLWRRKESVLQGSQS
jgi:hypothetical protein